MLKKPMQPAPVYVLKAREAERFSRALRFFPRTNLEIEARMVRDWVRAGKHHTSLTEKTL